MVEVDGEIALDAAGARLRRRIAPPAPGRHCGRARPPDGQGLAAPAGRPHAPAGRPLGARDPRGPGGPARPGASRHRQNGVTRPARPAGPPHSRVGRRAQQAAAQRLPHLHRRPAPPGGRRAVRRVDRQRRATRPAADRHAPARYRQGVPRRPHDRRHGSGRTHRDTHGVLTGRRRGARRPGAPPPAAARHRDPARPGRPDHHRPRGPRRRRPGDPAPPRRPDGGRQPGHRSVRLGPVEGRPRRRPRRTHRPRPPGRDQARGARSDPGGEPGPDGGGARVGSRRCHSNRPTSLWPHRTAAGSSPPWPEPWPSTA